MKRILLLDDQANIRRDLGSYLQNAGHGVYQAESIEQARKIVLSEDIEVAIVDLEVDYRTRFGGAEIVNFVRRQRPQAKIIVLSAYSTSTEPEIEAQFDGPVDGFVNKGGQENYIVAVSNKLDELATQERTRTCLVIMPIGTTESCSAEEWTEVFDQTIEPAVSAAGYHCLRSVVSVGHIIEGVLDNLNRSDLVVADLTDRNPNVFYELGVRHALRDATILISQNVDDIPFDLRPYATLLYAWRTEKGRAAFRRQIGEVLRIAEEEPVKVSSPVRKYLKL